ncbi:MAG: HPr family phosphocarrier protein [Rubrobacteraceae bacterium]
MVEKEVTIVPEEGLHARPAAEFVKEAKGYSSDIKVVKDGKEANAKSSLSLMSLGAKQGDKLTIRAEGEDEKAAAEALADLITNAEH